MKTKVFKERLIINNMIIKKIIYNNGKNEGYFIETRKGFVQVRIKEGEALKLKNIKEVKEVRISDVNLKVEDVKRNETYIG